MNHTGGLNYGSTSNNGAPSTRLNPDNYTTIDTLVKTNKDFVIPELVEAFGDQGITGFLKLTGAISNGGTNDQVDWWEAGRRHRLLNGTLDASSGNTDVLVLNGSAETTSTDGADPATLKNCQLNDVLMCTTTGEKYIVTNMLYDSDGDGITVARLDGAAFTVADPTGGDVDFIVLGNMYAQGTDQPDRFTDVEPVRYRNPFMIVKDRYQVNGSQATNVGWVDMGNGDYRWFMYGEQEARKRFEDRREMMMLFGEQHDGAAAQVSGLAGSDGYFTAVEDRGIVVSNANANPLDSFAEFDDIILELDKQGAPSEYAMYVNRKQDLAIDDMLASGIATQVTAGLPGQFGAFQNNADMAVQLGFKSFTRGGYTFHKHDWRLLNDPTMLGAATNNFLQGCMVPLRTVNDARSGASVPALSMHYKEANGYSREMEHWVTGGGVLGHNNNGDLGTDQAVFHYRSEIALCVRAANQHVVIKG